MQGPLIDRIYEAAFVPELWPHVLDDMAARSGSASAAVLVFNDRDRPPRYQTTALTRASLHEFTTTDRWRQSIRADAIFEPQLAGNFSRFLYLSDFLAPGDLSRDSVEKSLMELGLGAQITTVIPMLSGEVVSFTFERWAGDGSHTPEAIASLDRARPHLARSGLIAARLGLERAQATVSALRAIGLPAAVLHQSGRVLTVNSLFDDMSSLFLPTAHGGMAIADPAADKLFHEAIEISRGGHEPPVRSFPVVAREDRPGFVVHLLPLRRTAHEIFVSGDFLVAATAVGIGGRNPPAATILAGLFDLTPSEINLAVALAAGISLNEAAAANGITVKTGRTYLERIFAKTGTHSQSQLVALLKSAQPLGS